MPIPSEISVSARSLANSLEPTRTIRADGGDRSITLLNTVLTVDWLLGPLGSFSICFCSVLLEGEFGLNDLCIGVPVILGRNGIESIVEIDLDEVELTQLQTSAEGVKATNTLLNDLNL